MRRWLGLLLLLALPLITQGQAQTMQGQAIQNNPAVAYLPAYLSGVAGAQVSVCPGSTVPAANTVCTPVTATLYYDPAFTMAAPNPFTADGSGNYWFYLPTGQYVVSLKNPTLSTVYSYPIVVGSLGYYSSLEGIKMVDPTNTAGWAGSDPGAWINAADAAIGAGVPGVIEVASSPANYVATTVIQLGKNHVLRIRGYMTFFGIFRLADSTTDETGISGIYCPEGATLKLPNSANVDLISDPNFASLTGTTNAYGVVHSVIADGCTLDANKAAQVGTSYGVRVYGRGNRLNNVNEQNARNDGMWLEGHDPVAIVNPLDDDSSFGTNIRTIDNGGSGVNVVTEQGWSFVNLITWGNGGWGITTTAPVNVTYVQSFLNTLGGCHAGASGDYAGSNAQCTTSTGYGFKADTTAGLSFLTASIFASIGGTGLEIDGGSDSNFSGIVANGNGTLPAVNFGGASAGIYLNLVFFGNTGVQINFVAGGGSVLNISGSAPGGATCTGGFVPGVTIIGTIIGATGCSTGLYYFQNGVLSNALGGFGGANSNLPIVSGTLLTSGNGDAHIQKVEPVGCSTGASVGSTCASPIAVTWPVAFPDTNYLAVCTGAGVNAGVPSGPYVVGGSQTTTGMSVNYFAITAAAASYSNVVCIAIHNG